MTFKVAITSDMGTSARAFREHGFETVHLPCIRVVPDPVGCQIVRRLARDADRLVITSARVPGIVFGGEMPAVPVAVVGPETAAAVRRAGGTVDVVGSGGVRRLLDELPPSEGHVIFPHSSLTPETVLEKAKSLGIETIPVYQTFPTDPAEHDVDGVIFTSPSAVAGWAKARSFDGIVVGAIGETTATRLRSLGKEPEVVAPTPSMDALVDAFAEHVALHPKEPNGSD